MLVNPKVNRPQAESSRTPMLVESMCAVSGLPIDCGWLRYNAGTGLIAAPDQMPAMKASIQIPNEAMKA